MSTIKITIVAMKLMVMAGGMAFDGYDNVRRQVLDSPGTDTNGDVKKNPMKRR